MTLSRDQKVDVFRTLHSRKGAFIIPNPWDAGSARILTALGFEALATTSAGYAWSTGRLDSPKVVSRADILGNAKDIVEAVDLPVSADMQNGFGDTPEDAAQTIRDAVQVGLAGGSIEDSTGDPGHPIYDFGLAVERIQAAAEEARRLNFVLTARAENYLHGRPDIEDTLRRLQAFEAAGADVLYAPGIRNLDEIRLICSSVSRPVNVVMGFAGENFSVEELAAAGVKRVSVGGSLYRSALAGFLRAAQEMKERGTFSYGNDAISGKDVMGFMTDSL